MDSRATVSPGFGRETGACSLFRLSSGRRRWCSLHPIPEGGCLAPSRVSPAAQEDAARAGHQCGWPDATSHEAAKRGALDGGGAVSAPGAPAKARGRNPRTGGLLTARRLDPAPGAGLAAGPPEETETTVAGGGCVPIVGRSAADRGIEAFNNRGKIFVPTSGDNG